MSDQPKLLEMDALTTKVATRCTDLVPTSISTCPCGSRFRRKIQYQDALFRGGGYGGSQRCETDVCWDCGTTRVVAVANQRPPRR